FRSKPDFVITAVDMSDWQMLVERWDRGHNFPHFVHESKGPSRRRVTVTLRWLRASRGQFVYEDHETPWSIVCPNLDIAIENLPTYHGTATFSGGTVAIQHYVPMWAKMKAQFEIDGPRIRLTRIDLDTDGATTAARGVVDLAHWPDQTYTVQSRVDFPRMRQLFFTDERWDITGRGDFEGTFSLSKQGPDLAGTFASDLAGVNAYRFPSLYGSLRWTRHAFAVWNAGSKFYGGDAAFKYSIGPLGARVRPTHLFEATLTDVDLVRFTDFEQLAGLRFAGAASMHNVLEWPAGRFGEHRGEGHLAVSPPPGFSSMTPPPVVGADRCVGPCGADTSVRPYASPPSLTGHLPISGELTYQYGPSEVSFE